MCIEMRSWKRALKGTSAWPLQSQIWIFQLSLPLHHPGWRCGHPAEVVCIEESCLCTSGGAGRAFVHANHQLHLANVSLSAGLVCHSFSAFLPSKCLCTQDGNALRAAGWNRIFRFSSNLYLHPSNNENCLQCTTSSLLWIKMHFGNLSRFLAHLLQQLQSTERLGSLILPFL